MKYLQVSIITTHEAADLVSLILIDNGSEGTVIKDGEDIKELYKSGIIWDYIDNEVLEQANLPVTVSGFFSENFDLTCLESDLSDLKSYCKDCGSLEISLTKIDSENWENEWKKYYKPIEIGNVLILPKWLKSDSNAITVKLDPGMAFGTGNHETTSFCIRLMQELDLKNKTVFDVGCGSGILGITASKLGAKSVFMSDIDNVAIDAARENVALNEVKNIELYTTDTIGSFGVMADIIIANITVDILKKYRDEFCEYLSSKGALIVSGIIRNRFEEIKKFFEEKFSCSDIITGGEWRAMLMRKI